MNSGSSSIARRAIVVLVALPVACRGGKTGGEPSAKPAPVEPLAQEIEAPARPLPIEPLAWQPVTDTSPFGLPEGCRLGAAKKTRLPAGTARFTVPAGGQSELVLAVDRDGDGTVDRASLLDANGRPKEAVPWETIDAPPLFAMSSGGIVAVDRADAGNGRYRVELWREPGVRRVIAEGDALDAMDVACDGATCSVLTTVASSSAGPGATVFTGDPTSKRAMSRVDIAAEERGWTPLSITKMEGAVTSIALSTKDAISAVRVEKNALAKVGEIPAPFGVYDVVLASSPIVVQPAQTADGECTKDTFDLRFATPGRDPVTVDVQVPPEGIVTRRLANGFVVAWLAPLSCRHRAREMVRTLLLGPDGLPRTSTMAVAAADGFALSATNDTTNLWLSIDGDLVWLQGTCRVPEKN